MGITSSLSTAAQTLRTLQLAIQTTGHNMANVATPGFSRQRVDLVSAFPSREGGFSVGRGVEVAGIQRIVDRFMEAELLGLHANVGFTEAESRALAAVQEAFPVSGGIDAALGAFFNALSDLANNPGGLTERVSVIGKAQALGLGLAQTRQVFTSVQRNLDEDIRSAVARVNVLVEQIATLNRQVSLTEAEGESANDFRDQRQTLLQELAALTGASVRETGDGQMTATVDGLLLVGGERFATLQFDAVNPAGFHALTYQTTAGLSFDATALFTQGKIGSLLDMRDTEIQGMIDRLDQFAKTLVDEVNAQHALGFDLNGAAGGDFFAPIASVAGAAANVSVDAAIVADPQRIAAAEDAATVPGDNRNALALVNLQSATFAALGGMTLPDYFLALVGEVGARAGSAETRLDFQQQLLAQAQARRESVSGVNIDEEMVKLIQFQRAFEASALLMRTADEMYQFLIQTAR